MYDHTAPQAMLTDLLIICYRYWPDTDTGCYDNRSDYATLVHTHTWHEHNILSKHLKYWSDKYCKG